MTIEEFQAEASKAFESGIAVRTTLEMSRDSSTPRFRVSISEPDDADSVAWGSGTNAHDAINECKRRRAQAHEEKVEKARKLLASL